MAYKNNIKSIDSAKLLILLIRKILKYYLKLKIPKKLIDNGKFNSKYKLVFNK
jgi:hypothetical protein